jgi:hypothetical protein
MMMKMREKRNSILRKPTHINQHNQFSFLAVSGPICIELLWMTTNWTVVGDESPEVGCFTTPTEPHVARTWASPA